MKLTFMVGPGSEPDLSTFGTEEAADDAIKKRPRG
jgi:hypothetical protein